MLGIVVTGGLAPPREEVREELERADILIAADSGLDTLSSYGYCPDFVVGDMDSLKDRGLLESFDDKRVLVYPEDKDYTDTELAISTLYEKGCDSVSVIGGGGGRLDHLIAIYSLMFRDSAPLSWITDKEKVFLVKGKFCINLKVNTLVSLFPVSSEVCKMSSLGLKWSLDDLQWKPGDVGISNVAMDERVQINMKSGKLAMIIPMDNE